MKYAVPLCCQCGRWFVVTDLGALGRKNRGSIAEQVEVNGRPVQVLRAWIAFIERCAAANHWERLLPAAGPTNGDGRPRCVASWIIPLGSCEPRRRVARCLSCDGDSLSYQLTSARQLKAVAPSGGFATWGIVRVRESYLGGLREGGFSSVREQFRMRRSKSYANLAATAHAISPLVEPDPTLFGTWKSAVNIEGDPVRPRVKKCRRVRAAWRL
jgi:hypothetical protein